MNFLLQIILLIVGFAMLVKGADWFVDGAAGIAAKLGVPQLVIGLTIVAMGTSAPEAAISISSSLKGSAEIAVGNVLGSNIMNVLLILGITAVISALAIQKSTVRYEIPFVIVITVVLMTIGLMDNELGRVDGIILWVLFIVYLVYLFIMAKNGNDDAIEEVDIDENDTILKLVAMLIVGGIVIVIGSDVTVDAAINIATALGLSKRFIGLTIVAFGTSLPELVTCIVAATKNKADIAIGNIVGSNIFNILFVLGTSALITPVAYQSVFKIDSIICIAAVVILLLLVLNKERKLKRLGGIVMLVAYAGYFAYLLKV